ncbi:MAG TPA: DUF2089 domain-containing protein [Ktedonobacterales bacterium]|nr:DUF2089 domain-containing protein [Ktedonobacterales bacterium]
MPQTWKAPEICPVCGDHLTITRLSCDRCGSALEGAFEAPTSAGEAREGTRRSGPLGGAGRGDAARFGRLTRLDDEQLGFVEVFLRCRGVIKNVEDMLGVSYPTVRARLNAVLETMGFGADEEPAPAERRRARREILSELAAGRISAEEAHELLARAHALTDEDH